ncbi:hypothetical protein DFH11DRAFT_1539783 [Phellopilus nigrolimitatus]|nr:hypothetical protein DFH11DRAFT_1539783 [Phellopilus nigrolimitatus]
MGSPPSLVLGSVVLQLLAASPKRAVYTVKNQTRVSEKPGEPPVKPNRGSPCPRRWRCSAQQMPSGYGRAEAWPRVGGARVRLNKTLYSWDGDVTYVTRNFGDVCRCIGIGAAGEDPDRPLVPDRALIFPAAVPRMPRSLARMTGAGSGDSRMLDFAACGRIAERMPLWILCRAAKKAGRFGRSVFERRCVVPRYIRRRHTGQIPSAARDLALTLLGAGRVISPKEIKDSGHAGANEHEGRDARSGFVAFAIDSNFEVPISADELHSPKGSSIEDCGRETHTVRVRALYTYSKTAREARNSASPSKIPEVITRHTGVALAAKQPPLSCEGLEGLPASSQQPSQPEEAPRSLRRVTPAPCRDGTSGITNAYIYIYMQTRHSPFHGFPLPRSLAGRVVCELRALLIDACAVRYTSELRGGHTGRFTTSGAAESWDTKSPLCDPGIIEYKSLCLSTNTRYSISKNAVLITSYSIGDANASMLDPRGKKWGGHFSRTNRRARVRGVWNTHIGACGDGERDKAVEKHEFSRYPEMKWKNRDWRALTKHWQPEIQRKTQDNVSEPRGPVPEHLNVVKSWHDNLIEGDSKECTRRELRLLALSSRAMRLPPATRRASEPFNAPH